jgi:hypothetical protein
MKTCRPQQCFSWKPDFFGELPNIKHFYMCPSFKIKLEFCASPTNMHYYLKRSLVVSPGLNHRVADFKSFKTCRERSRQVGRMIADGCLVNALLVIL